MIYCICGIVQSGIESSNDREVDKIIYTPKKMIIIRGFSIKHIFYVCVKETSHGDGK